MSRKHTLAIGCLLLAALAAAYAFVSGFSAREDRKREQAEAAGVIPFTDCAELAALSYTSAGPPSHLRRTKMEYGSIRRTTIFPLFRPLSRPLPMIWET